MPATATYPVRVGISWVDPVHLAEARMRDRLVNALLGYYAECTDATEEENNAAVDLILRDHMRPGRMTLAFTADHLAAYLRVVRDA